MKENHPLRIAKVFISIIITIVVLLFVFAAFAILLSGSETRLTEGEVYDKSFTVAHSQTLMLPIVHSNGKTTYTTMIPYIRNYPDTYSISIRDFQDGEWITETYYVSKEVYNDVEIGDIFKYEIDRDLEEAPYTQARQ